MATTTTTEGTFIVTRKLDNLERTVLAGCLAQGEVKVRAFAVWVNRDGEIEMGPIRHGRAFLVDGHTAKVNYSCSPFPGCWVEIPEDQILRVSAPSALVDPATAMRIYDERWQG